MSPRWMAGHCILIFYFIQKILPLRLQQIIRLNDIILDDDTRERMIHIEEQCDILSKRLKSIQEIAAQTIAPTQPALTRADRGWDLPSLVPSYWSTADRFLQNP